MGARKKLNAAFFNGAIILGVAFGAAFQSFLIAFCVFALVVGLGLYSGDIRLTPTNKNK
jgi:hypothetical protein